MPVAALIGLSSCAAIRLGDVRTDPTYNAGPLRQVAVFAFGMDDAVRPLTEDEFALRLPATTRGVAGYRLVPAAERGDVARVKERLRAGGFDGAVIVRAVGGGESGASQTFGDAYAAAQAADARPDAAWRLETSVYSLASDARIWSATSRSFKPDDLREVSAGVARVVMQRLQAAGLLVDS